MDHIESVPDSPYAPIQIPCLSPEPYDGKDFSTYPERAGWDSTRLLAGDFSQHPAEPTGAFLQNWLYFGVLWEVFSPITKGAKDNYLKPQEGTAYGIITIPSLEDQFLQLSSLVVSMVQGGDAISGQIIAHRIIKCLQIVSIFCRLATCEGDPRPGFTVWPLSPEVDLSIRCLGYHLASRVPFGGLGMVMKYSTTGLIFPCAWFPLGRMQQMGWCPSEIAMVEDTFSSASVYYASQMERPPSAVKRDHGECTRRLCAARQIKEATYRTAHTKAECDCQHLGPAMDEVASIIASGGIPLLSIIPTKKEPYCKVEVERYSGLKRYVAFSHVWSDGLGNATANTLPRCQLLRIRDLLDELLSGISSAHLVNRLALGELWKKKFRGPSISFWIDTMCIPVAPEHHELRSKAIKGMKDIYERAFRVLVLDSDIQECSMRGYTQSLMRIRMSAWMRRLWTLNEGVLANRLCVKYADGILDVQAASESYEKQKKTAGLSPFLDSYGSPARDADNFGWKFRLLRVNVLREPDPRIVTSGEIQSKGLSTPAGQKRCYAIMEAFSASVHRTTSKMTDEMLCFASLIGWDTSLLKGVPFEDHMHAFLSTESQLPQGILFLAGPRMRQPGWRWAVNRFGDNGAIRLNVKFDDTTPGDVSENGFIVDYHGLALPVDCTRQQTQKMIVVTEDENGIVARLGISRHDEGLTNRRDEPSLVSESVIHDRLYVLYWHTASSASPRELMPAALISGPSDEDRISGEVVYRFESLAYVEVLETGLGWDLQQKGDRVVQLIKKKWTLG